MTKEESDGFLRGIATVIKEQIDAATATLRTEIEELKARPLISGKDGQNGKDADPELIRLAVAEILPGMVERSQEVLSERVHGWVNQLPIPKDGQAGANGKDADEDAIAARVLASVEPLVAKAVSAIPVPRDGRDGLPGTSGAPGTPGLNGAEGAPGRDGVDGLGFDDLTVERSGSRGVVVKFARGERVKEFPLTFPIVLDAGVYVEDKDYEPGDGTSHAGCFWIAQEPTREKPGTSKAWRLAVKKGRDGKGDKGDPGKPGAKGTDGRNFDGTRAY